MASSAPASLRHIPFSYNNADSQASALRLLFTLFPDWENSDGEVKFTRFTDGITNTLLKATKRRPGLTDYEIDQDAVLLRAYGKDTQILIDREKETSSHLLLASHNLAPALLARFQNGMLYRFIQGKVCSPADLTREPVWRGVAQRLGEWHAVLPVIASSPALHSEDSHESISMSPPRSKLPASLDEINSITPGKLTPNIWTIMQKWIFALPTATPQQQEQKELLQRELKKTVTEFADLPGLGPDGLVFGHCDLLSGNVIMQPGSASSLVTGTDVETVSFIDFEYATPAPAAFDLANHFAEWGGFDCDYNMLPTKETRRAFLAEYWASYQLHSNSLAKDSLVASGSDVDALFEAVDKYRGIPGLYWGIWALIQATISQIDFDYASYAIVRLNEYWAWRDEATGERERISKEKPLRERRWAEE